MFGTRKGDQASVARAFMMAAALPVPFKKAVRVTVRSSDGTVLGEGLLNGFEQLDFLRDQLEIVSSFVILTSGGGPHRTWDLLFQERGSPWDEAQEADGVPAPPAGESESG